MQYDENLYHLTIRCYCIVPAVDFWEVLCLLKKPVPWLLPTSSLGSWLPCPCPACGVAAVDIQSSMSAGSHMKSVMRSSALRVPLIAITAHRGLTQWIKCKTP